MSKLIFLNSSLEQLNEITEKTHNEQILPIAKSIWQKHLQADNPLWKYIVARPFSIDNKDESAHLMAMIDKRLPNIGLVGFFACSNSFSGSKVLKLATDWLYEKHGIKNVYGPINGTITRDYRLNLADDFCFPGEPVNPLFYIDAFHEAGFKVFNRYVSGISKHYQFFIRFITTLKPSKKYSHLIVRPFDTSNQLRDLRIYHDLMNAIFPSQSIYCPILSYEERIYNVADNNPIFDPNYTYFLEDKNHAVGFILSYPYNKSLIVKTIGLLPEYRGKRLSGLLLQKVHDHAKQDGLETAIYAMIRVGNSVYKMKRPGVKEYRKYVTMYKSL